MRAFLVVLSVVLFFIITIPLDIVLYFIGKTNPELRMSISQSMVRGIFRIILKAAGADITVDGLDQIPEDEAVLFVGNHQSYFDILVTCIYIKRGVGYVAKKEMIKIPFLNIWMKGINCLFLDRDNIKEGLKTILQGVDELKKGHSMFIFPEGTRNQSGQMLPFKEGSTKMAEKAKVPIIPVAITGTPDLFENNHAPKVTAAKVHVSFGKPIHIGELEKEEKKFLGAYVQKQIQEMLDMGHTNAL
jgi:1-acyl-sn-glycerol-3-phosphate acyltransferase